MFFPSVSTVPTDSTKNLDKLEGIGSGRSPPPADKNPLLDSMSPKERREWENGTCLGGLRNPRFAMEKLPLLRAAGKQIHDFLSEFIDLQGESFIEDLLRPTAADMAKSLEASVSDFLAKKLGCSPRRGNRGKLRPEIATAISQLSRDPDVAVTRWMDEGAPLGIAAPIETCGVFPTIQKETATAEAETFYTKTTEGLIYRSAVDEAPWVQGKLDEMVADSSMLVFQDLAAAEAALGPLVISKLA